MCSSATHSNELTIAGCNQGDCLCRQVGSSNALEERERVSPSIARGSAGLQPTFSPLLAAAFTLTAAAAAESTASPFAGIAAAKEAARRTRKNFMLDVG